MYFRKSYGGDLKVMRRGAYSLIGDAVLAFVRANICPQAENSDISFSPRKADISIRLSRRCAEPDEAAFEALLRDMPEYDGISVFSGAYVESGYVNFTVDNGFLLGCAEKANFEFPDIRMPGVIELPESPEYAAVKLMNFAQVFTEFPLNYQNRRALWLCLGLEGDTDRAILKRRLHAAVKAALDACNAKNAALGGKPASAMAKLIIYAAQKVNKPLKGEQINEN